MELDGWGTKLNLALAFRLVHFIALRSNCNHEKYNLEPIILQLSSLSPLGSYCWKKSALNNAYLRTTRSNNAFNNIKESWLWQRSLCTFTIVSPWLTLHHITLINITSLDCRIPAYKLMEYCGFIVFSRAYKVPWRYLQFCTRACISISIKRHRPDSHWCNQVRHTNTRG